MQREGLRRTEYMANDRTNILDMEKKQQDNPATDRPPRRIPMRLGEFHV